MFLCFKRKMGNMFFQPNQVTAFPCSRGRRRKDEENTIFSEKGEKNKDRCLSERNGHDDAVVALSEIESRRRLGNIEGVLLSPREWKPQPFAQSCAEKARLFEFELASVQMLRLSYPTETVLTNKMTRNRIVIQRQSQKTIKTATYTDTHSEFRE